MKIDGWLKYGDKKLADAGISSARLDCLILLEDLLGKDRAWLLAHQDTELSEAQTKKLSRQIERRTTQEPLAYIRGFSEFYGRKFKVSKRVLQPRPESETMIDLLKALKLPTRPAIADVGTGSGCLGITAALEMAGATVDLYDIDSSALAVAKHNSQMYELKLETKKRDLLNRPLRRYDVILANLPYIPDSWNIDRSIQAEPRIAFLGGRDGLEHYRRLFSQVAKLAWPKVYILCESMPPQHQQLTKIADGHNFSQMAERDFIQVFVN
jgi:release factor glutamine methyltransferase